MPLITTRANIVYGSGFGKSAAAIDTGAMFEIGMVQVGSAGASSITFSSIPSTYKHLQIRGLMRAFGSVSGLNILKYRYNSDSGSNYTGHTLYGTGSSALATSATSQTYGWFSRTSSPTSASLANTFGAFVIDIFDYTSTSKNKTSRAISGVDRNGSGAVELTSSVWLNSANAINRIDLYDESSDNFMQYSTFALYGIKGEVA